MKFIKKFESLDFEKESHISEGVLFLSPKLKIKLNQILRTQFDSPVTIALLGKEGDVIDKDWTFIDSSDEPDGISFINQSNAEKLISDAKINFNFHISDRKTAMELWSSDLINNDSGISRKSRNNMKIGRFIKGIFGDKFTDKQIELFVNQFKSVEKNDKLQFKLVSGDEISKWYLPVNLKYPGRGSLSSSCMTGEDKNKFFKLYTENPETCSLLILLEGEKLVGRALVWKLNEIKLSKDFYGKMTDDNQDFIEEAKYFMDRVYTSDDYLFHKFFDYSDKMGWARRTSQRAGEMYQMTYKGRSFNVYMSVKVKKLNYGPYPYLDTFMRYNHFNGTLNNDDSRRKGGHILNSTQGSYRQSIDRKRYYINRFKDFFRN